MYKEAVIIDKCYLQNKAVWAITQRKEINLLQRLKPDWCPLIPALREKVVVGMGCHILSDI